MSTQPYVINACTIVVKLENVDKLLAALTKNAAAVKEKEPRCLMYEFFQPENAEEIVLLEKFPKMEDFYVHLEQPHTQAFLKEAETLMEGEPKVRLSNGPNGQGGFAR
ncbi:hypothetical protein CC79DRAFT_1400685 [Sarocladium strictum]